MFRQSRLIPGYVTEDGPDFPYPGSLIRTGLTPNFPTGGGLMSQPENRPAPAMPISPVPGRKQYVRQMVTWDHPVKDPGPFAFGKVGFPSPLLNTPETYQSPLNLRSDFRRPELLYPDSRLV